MATLHLLCGKIASGKSTLASSLATDHAAILLSEDHWLATLYPGQIKTIAITWPVPGRSAVSWSRW